MDTEGRYWGGFVDAVLLPAFLLALWLAVCCVAVLLIACTLGVPPW